MGSLRKRLSQISRIRKTTNPSRRRSLPTTTRQRRWSASSFSAWRASCGGGGGRPGEKTHTFSFPWTKQLRVSSEKKKALQPNYFCYKNFSVLKEPARLPE